MKRSSATTTMKAWSRVSGLSFNFALVARLGPEQA